jgi:hypothetical protein
MGKLMAIPYDEWTRVRDRKNASHQKLVAAYAKRIEKAYLAGHAKPHYPVPAKRMRTFDSLKHLGYVAAENGFPVEAIRFWFD